MMSRKLSSVLSVAIATAVVTLSADSNWPQWRGPLATGAAVETTSLPVRWSTTTGENIAWKLVMPSRSGATPIVWNDTIFLNVAAQPDAGDVELWSLNRSAGTIRWKKTITSGNYQINKQNMSSPSPVTDGKTVWVLTGRRHPQGVRFRWHGVVVARHSEGLRTFGLNWGYASSPLLHEGMLYVQVLHGMKTDDPSYVLKIDGKTGKTLWKVERPTDAQVESPDSYTTPALLEYHGKKEIVVTGGDVVTGHDHATGQELWRADGLNPGKARNYRIIASPVVAGGLVIAPTRIRPMIAIKPGGRGNVTATHTAWTFDRGPDVPTPATDGRLLYCISDRGVVEVLDVQTGAVLYGPERLRPAIYSASPVIADGKIYVTNEDGLTSVFRAGSKFELLAENASDEYTLSTIAVSKNQLFLRTEKHLYAIGK